MVCPIMKDPIFLARRAQPVEAAEAEELSQNLKDTLLAHREECVGMAANMIGVCRRAIVFDDGRMSRCSPALRPLRAGLHRSFSMKSITATAF